MFAAQRSSFAPRVELSSCSRRVPAFAAGAPQTGADSGAQSQKVVCRDIHTPTSRIVSHVCNSPAEWARLAREQKNSPALNIVVDTSSSARFWVLCQDRRS